MDEKEAHHILADMQARIARSAYDALNITVGDVGPEHVRAAFLQLAKKFHPHKFARMAPETQKLATEVFIGLRAAHDQLVRPKAAAPARQSQQMPTFIAAKTPPEQVRANNNASGIRPAPPVAARPNAPPPPSAAINPQTQRGVPPAPAASAANPARPAAPPATAARPPIQSASQPAAARPPVTAAATRTGVGAPIRRNTPPGGMPAVKQPTPAAGMPAVGGAEPELTGVYDQLQKGQFEQARATLNALIALQPKPRYRALLSYSVGREAQLANRRDEARVDLHEALEIDPDLQLAKTALSELFTRRK